MSISPATVARVFHEVSFKNNTRIAASTVALSAEYIRLFVHEAIVRANAQRLAELPPTEVDGIDNVEGDVLENEENDQFRDTQLNEERGLGLPTQRPPARAGNDTLDSRHLTAVVGMLVMDF